MNFDLIDKKLDTFIKYQMAILRTARLDYVILCLGIMVVAVGILFFTTTQVHHKEITGSIAFAMFCIFPGPIALALAVSFFSYLKNKNKSIAFEQGSIIYDDKKLGHDLIWFIEMLGPNVMNLQMKGILGFRFVSDDILRNKMILEEVRKIKPNIEIKQNFLGKIQ